MPAVRSHRQTERQLSVQLQTAQARLAELEGTLAAIRSGEVDAIVVDGPQGTPRVFTLQSPEEPYRLLAERMNEGAATLTSEGMILFCNQRMSEMLGIPAERLVGTPFVPLLNPEEQSQFQDLMHGAMDNDARAEAHLVRRDRSIVAVQLALSRIPLDEAEGICLVATDLTRQKEAEEQIRRLNAELEQRVRNRTAALEAVNKELEAFSYAVAHDLRAPLRHIHGFSDILLRDTTSVLSEDGRHCLDCIVKGTTRMEMLVEHLLSLSRLGRQPLNRRRTDLGQLVREVIDELAPERGDREIEWQVGPVPTIVCDPVLIKLVFTILLSNAIKFTRSRPKTVISIGQQGSEDIPVVFVRDNGAGFDMKYADKLFGVFQRLHHEKEFDGIGIGLATALRIVQKHGGRIWAEAKVDEGATFYLTIPGEEYVLSRKPALEAVS